MIQNEPVSEIMVKNIIALNREDDLESAEKLFNKYKIKHIPVVSADVVIGMLSYSDFLKTSIPETAEDPHNINSVVYNAFSIEQVMSKNIVCINSKTSIREAATILAKREFHALPVVDDGVLTGIVTTRDLLNYYIKQY
ncbi:acetoin utilization protein AcuB [Mariniflexile fucanivorans]|uniref:Acetoin utilization protein AcuB n=1 Tax=Mariniflexile fucanivorans TaxID=264023 RepID=A0A4V2QE95_9FLAO|nr:CBS domain-containing protein [Mariniflexile fucanivorans]TCL67087.1 acetoin utilization protein AcuB [Mariniflexile fucanivorans]